MTIASEITRIKTNIENAYAKAEEKGATMPELLNSENLAGCIESVPKSEGGGGGNDYDAPEGYYYVIYYDIDGTILYKDMAKAEENYTIPAEYTGKYDPENLVFNKWFCPSLYKSDDDNYQCFLPLLQNVHLVALYINKDDIDVSKIYIETDEDNQEFIMAFDHYYTTTSQLTSNVSKVLIDWGDGNQEYATYDECIDNVGGSTQHKYCIKKHIYNSIGEYIIKLTGLNINDEIKQWAQHNSMNCYLAFDKKSAESVTKIYEGRSMQTVLSQGGCNYNYRSMNKEYYLKNLEICTFFDKYYDKGNKNINIPNTTYNMTNLIANNKKLKVFIERNDSNGYFNDTDILYVKLIFSTRGLNTIYSCVENRFEVMNYINNNLWKVYRGEKYVNYDSIYTLTPIDMSYNSFEISNYTFLRHIDKHFLFKGDSSLIIINKADETSQLLLTFSEFLEFLDSDRFDDYFDLFIEENKIYQGGYCNDRIHPFVYNDISIGEGVRESSRGILPIYNDVLIKSNNIAEESNGKIKTNCTTRVFGNAIICPGIISDNTSQGYGISTQINNCENFKNTEGIVFHPIFKKFDMVTYQNSLAFDYLNNKITELDLRNLNLVYKFNSVYNRCVRLSLKYTNIGKVLLDDAIEYIGLDGSSYDNPMFSYSNATIIDISNFEGKKINFTYMFQNCPNLQKVIMPKNFTMIGKYITYTSGEYYGMFNSCKKLEEFEIPEQFDRIHGGMFRECTSLKKVWLPSTCTNIYTSSSYTPFYSCTNKNLIVYTDATEKPSGWADNWNKIDSSKTVQVYWGATKENYENGDPIPA